MRTLTKHEAKDGSLHDAVVDALKRDAYIEALDAADAILGPKPDANGANYVQHERGRIEDYIAAIVEALGTYESARLSLMFRENPRGIVGRYLDDSRSPAYRASYRVMCIDADDKEWGQPYFVLHPNPEAKAMGVPE